MAMTPEQLKDLAILVQTINLEFGAGIEAESRLKEIQTTIGQVIKEIEKELMGTAAEINKALTPERQKQVIEQAFLYAELIKSKLANDTVIAGNSIAIQTLEEYERIYSFHGAASQYNFVKWSPQELHALFVGTPVGGVDDLANWIERTFEGAKEQLRREMAAGILQGHSYPKLVKRIMAAFGQINSHEATTLVRTFSQAASVASQNKTMKANPDVFMGWQWSAILEAGYMRTGRGTCPRCAGLDGNVYKVDDPNAPDMPLHPRCRCIKIPKTVPWSKLGVKNMPEWVNQRPYTIRPNQNIDAGGKRVISEVGKHGGDMSSFFKKRNRAFKANMVGPRRMEYWDAGKVRDLRDFVNPKTGELYTLAQLAKKYGKPPKPPGGKGGLTPPKPKPKPTPSGGAKKAAGGAWGISTGLKNPLAAEEKRTQFFKREQATLFTEDGTQLGHWRGGKRSVSFSGAEARAMKGHILTHNHPGGGSFSRQDLNTAVTYKLKEIRAVGTKHVHRVRTRGLDGLNQGTRQIISNDIKKYYGQVDEKLWTAVYNEKQEMIKKGVPYKEVEAFLIKKESEHWHNVNKRVAKKFPQYINYRREDF